MLNISRRTDYAFVALATLARQAGTCVSSTRLAETSKVPQSLLRNILKDLARADLVRSERGPFGGYAFDREPGSVDLLRIVEAIDGPIALVRCCSPKETEEDGCTHSYHCQIQHAMRKMHERVLGVLRRTTVADLIADPDDDNAVPLSIMVADHGAGESGMSRERTRALTTHTDWRC